MNKDRLWIIGAVAAMVIVALAGWFVGISPILDQATAASSQAQSISANNHSSELQLVTLKKQFAQIGTLQANLDSLRQSIPSDGDIDAFLKEIDTLTTAHHVTLTSATVNAATVYVNAATPATGAASAPASTTPTATPTPVATAAAGATATAVPGAGAGSNFVMIPVVLNVTGSFPNVLAFTAALQTGERLYLVTQATATESNSTPGQYEATLTGDVFALKGTATTTAAPKPSATATPVATPSATPTP